MYRRIVVPLDGSELAEAALTTAEALARPASGTLYLVQAAPPDDEACAVAYLEEVAQRLRARGLEVATLVLPGQPADVVVWQATHNHADLIVMSTHGRGGASRWVLGSVADQVLHRTARPVLLVRPGQGALTERTRRVLVPLDGSPLAEQALGHARAIAGTEGEILLYQVLAPATPIVPDAAPESFWAGMLEEGRAEALQYLDGLATAAQTAGYRVGTAAEYGVPALCIANYAREQAVDLIIISSHGRSGAARWLLGSVADELVRSAPAPLLLLRPLLAMAQQPVAEAVTAGPALDQALPPPAVLALTGEQVQLVRLGLEALRANVALAEPITREIDSLIGQVGGRARPATGTGEANVAGAQLAGPSLAVGGHVDPALIQPGHPVFACQVDREGHVSVGQYIGVVQGVLTRSDVYYVHVRGGLGRANELFLPLGAVRAVGGGGQVHLNLSVEDLVGQAWHLEPAASTQETWDGISQQGRR
jgi:nucleotide-binding universal stress UspA family protein